MKELPVWRRAWVARLNFDVFEIVTADHGFDFASGVVYGDESSLRSGNLFELDLRGGAGDLFDLHSGKVARPSVNR